MFGIGWVGSLRNYVLNRNSEICRNEVKSRGGGGGGSESMDGWGCAILALDWYPKI